MKYYNYYLLDSSSKLVQVESNINEINPGITDMNFHDGGLFKVYNSYYILNYQYIILFLCNILI